VFRNDPEPIRRRRRAVKPAAAFQRSSRKMLLRANRWTTPCRRRRSPCRQES
jgi:hypothetical protein